MEIRFTLCAVRTKILLSCLIGISLNEGCDADISGEYGAVDHLNSGIRSSHFWLK